MNLNDNIIEIIHKDLLEDICAFSSVDKSMVKNSSLEDPLKYLIKGLYIIWEKK